MEILFFFSLKKKRLECKAESSFGGQKWIVEKAQANRS
jgi:hypothetical protein